MYDESWCNEVHRLFNWNWKRARQRRDMRHLDYYDMLQEVYLGLLKYPIPENVRLSTGVTNQFHWAINRATAQSARRSKEVGWTDKVYAEDPLSEQQQQQLQAQDWIRLLFEEATLRNASDEEVKQLVREMCSDRMKKDIAKRTGVNKRTVAFRIQKLLNYARGRVEQLQIQPEDVFDTAGAV